MQVCAGMCSHDEIYTQIAVFSWKLKFSISWPVRASLMLLINVENSGWISKGEKKTQNTQNTSQGS